MICAPSIQKTYEQDKRPGTATLVASLPADKETGHSTVTLHFCVLIIKHCVNPGLQELARDSERNPMIASMPEAVDEDTYVRQAEKAVAELEKMVGCPLDPDLIQASA